MPRNVCFPNDPPFSLLTLLRKSHSNRVKIISFLRNYVSGEIHVQAQREDDLTQHRLTLIFRDLSASERPTLEFTIYLRKFGMYTLIEVWHAARLSN